MISTWCCHQNVFGGHFDTPPLPLLSAQHGPAWIAWRVSCSLAATAVASPGLALAALVIASIGNGECESDQKGF
jgi:hypothetical protein